MPAAASTSSSPELAAADRTASSTLVDGAGGGQVGGAGGDEPTTVALPKTSESPQLLRIRHSMSHVMAMAVQKLFPKAQVTIGPWTESGFYYDFDSPDPFTEADLKAIKKEMIKIINKKLPLERLEVSRAEAETRIKAQNEPYKLEILEIGRAHV